MALRRAHRLQDRKFRGYCVMLLRKKFLLVYTSKILLGISTHKLVPANCLGDLKKCWVVRGEYTQSVMV